MMNTWYRTGLYEDAVVSLTRCEEEVIRLRKDSHSLKWMLISLHSTVQGFMALVLDQGNLINLMRVNDAEKWLKAHEQGEQYPVCSMDRFRNLYKKIKKPEFMAGIVNWSKFSQKSHDDQIKWLNEQRNQFIHFNISGWSINIAEIHLLIDRMMDIVEFCAKNPHFPWHRLEDSEKARRQVIQTISRIRTAANEPFTVV
jgi:hypothetical protein